MCEYFLGNLKFRVYFGIKKILILFLFILVFLIILFFMVMELLDNKVVINDIDILIICIMKD